MPSFLEKVQNKISMSRGVLVLDDNVENLESLLKEKNITIIVPEKGLSDTKIKKTLLAHRILVTKNTKDFLKDAPVYEYGIISLEHVLGDPEKIVQYISDAITRHSLWAKKYGFLLTLNAKGKGTLKEITD